MPLKVTVAPPSEVVCGMDGAEAAVAPGKLPTKIATTEPGATAVHLEPCEFFAKLAAFSTPPLATEG